MPNKTSQVQRKKRFKKFPDIPPEVRLALRKDTKERLESQGYPVFLKPDVPGRQYPGEAEGMHLACEIDDSPKAKREKLLKLLRIMRNCEETISSGDTRIRAKAARTARDVFGRLERTILSGRNFTLGVSRQGLIVQPYTNQGMTAFALLSLFDQRKVSRLRQCLHCRSWFYARFKHQRFCPFLMNKCQWNHYHTPEWRRQHREQNRKHQRAYRERNFGNRKHRS